jgi:hypothetical protein
MAKQIFRKVSLERLSSPEQLDLMLKITSPAGWLSLLTIGLLLVMGILWGIYGSIPTKVIGKGILIKSGGVFSVDAPTSGKITGIYANVDSIIEKGQIVARIAQPNILDQINETKAKTRIKYFINCLLNLHLSTFRKFQCLHRIVGVLGIRGEQTVGNSKTLEKSLR